MALNGEAGFQPDLIRGGFHLFMPLMYRIHRQKLITVRGIAYAFARDGIPLPAGQTLAKTPPNVFFDDARGFLANGGQRGPQRQILREGVYAINTALFVVLTSEETHAIDVGEDKSTIAALDKSLTERKGFDPFVIRSDDDLIGIVTVHDGPVLDHGEIIAPTVGMDRSNEATFHNSFQDIEKFLSAGGCRGRQEQPLVEGTFYINRIFATVETVKKTIIEIGTVGVVISYTGKSGEDISGADYKHGRLVKRGERGVWAEPLFPGKYPFNPYAFHSDPVPTTNFVLRWITGRQEDHGFDANLAEIKLITSDAFEPVLPLSIVVHISPENAPRLIQQFAKVKLLVDQTIDPMVSAYFKDSAQKMSMLELISKRTELQQDALKVMKERFAQYNIEVMEVLIGTPKSPTGDDKIETLFNQLRDRQLASEQIATYQSQSKAAAEKLNLNQAQAKAQQQTSLTESLVKVEIAENEGKAQLRLQEQAAAAIRVTAEAEAFKVTTEGNAQATKISAIGKAEGDAIQAQVKAYEGEGGERKLRATIAELITNAMQHASQPLVPGIMINGGTENDSKSSMVEGLMAMMLADKTKIS